jgi:CDGSH-type Zn-finger protein
LTPERTSATLLLGGTDAMADDRPIPQRFPFVVDELPGEKWWCRCGRSKNQPYCDGSHKGTAFTPEPVTFAAPRKVAWCACKRTGTPPFCDGSHKRLPLQ